jgi:hypothetical protein
MDPFVLKHSGQLPGQRLDLGRPALVQQQERLFQQGESHVVGLPLQLEGAPRLPQQLPGFQKPTLPGCDAALQPGNTDGLVLVSSRQDEFSGLLHQLGGLAVKADMAVIDGQVEAQHIGEAHVALALH